MFKNSIIYIYFLFYFLSLGYTHAIALGRLTYSDILVIPLIVLSLLKITFNSKQFYIPKTQKIYILFLLLFLISTAFSFFKYQNEDGLFEYLVHIFSFLIFFSIYQLLYDESQDIKINIVNIWFYSMGVISVVSIIDFIIFPIFPHEHLAGGLVGGFRNTGQAGTFISISIILGVSLYRAGFIKIKILAYVLFVSMFIALILTVKRAAIIGVILSILLLVVFPSGGKNKVINRIFLLFSVFVIAIFLYSIFQWALENVDGLAWRFEYKVSNYSGSGQSDFLFEQIEKSLIAFSKEPILGLGAGGIYANLGSDHEIHNGYLKILIGSGIVGFFIFSYFYISIFKTLYSIKNTSLQVFSSTLLPMLIGLSISWAYSYPLRKREFWVFLAIVFIVLSLAKGKKHNDF